MMIELRLVIDRGEQKIWINKYQIATILKNKSGCQIRLIKEEDFYYVLNSVEDVLAMIEGPKK